MSQLKCLRCNGMMVIEDWNGSSKDITYNGETAYRCVQCGFIVDETIARNKGLYGTPAPTLTTIEPREGE